MEDIKLILQLVELGCGVLEIVVGVVVSGVSFVVAEGDFVLVGEGLFFLVVVFEDVAFVVFVFDFFDLFEFALVYVGVFVGGTFEGLFDEGGIVELASATFNSTLILAYILQYLRNALPLRKSNLNLPLLETLNILNSFSHQILTLSILIIRFTFTSETFTLYYPFRLSYYLNIASFRQN